MIFLKLKFWLKVSDAITALGLEDGRYVLGQMEIEVQVSLSAIFFKDLQKLEQQNLHFFLGESCCFGWNKYTMWCNCNTISSLHFLYNKLKYEKGWKNLIDLLGSKKSSEIFKMLLGNFQRFFSEKKDQ